MKNPLRKRYIRELKNDFGKYLVIFLFFVILIGLVSGYLVVADSLETTFYDNFEKYHVEDGHITFNKLPEQSIIDDLEKDGNITIYDLQYVEEEIERNGAKLRIYKDRKEVNRVCLMSGSMPEKDSEIAIDRVFANNNQYVIGDQLVLKGKEYTISGLVALVDYGCLFENESDMMFNAVNFGVAVMTESGYDALESEHISYNYAFAFNEKPETDENARQRSEDLLDILEDVLKDYDTKIIQSEVDEIYDEAQDIQDKLKKEFEKASDEIEEKMEKAATDAFNHVKGALSDEDMMKLYMEGAKPEDYFDAAAKKKGTTKDDLIAKELGTTKDALDDVTDAFSDSDNNLSSIGDKTDERPVINLDEIDEGYENDMDFSLDSVYDLVHKMEAANLYDTKKIESLLGQLEDLMHFEFDKDKLLTVEGYTLRVDSKAVNYCMDDMGTDKPMFILFDYIVVALLAFVFAVTISNTISSEAGVIGTLRASGYSKRELVLHYLFLPVLVTIVAAIVGNIAGYTLFIQFYKGVFYNSFSLATYQSIFNNEAFYITTVIPLIMMIAINLIMLVSKMNISPIQFLRHDLTKKKKRRAMLLNKKMPFMTRFRLRILFQNLPAYITLMIGIIFGGVILVFGLMFGPMLEDYADLIIDSKISEYQYVLTKKTETKTEGAEKYCITSMDSVFEGYLTDTITIYGVEEDSQYITTAIPKGQVLVSNGIASKFNLEIGDTLKLKDPVNGKIKEFIVGGEYQYDAALCIFMNRDQYLDEFNEQDDFFSGYFSNQKITDIENADIATVITQKDLVKVSEQMLVSMGGMMKLFLYFGIVLFLLMMYLMTKQIIEKNMQSIAMTKILGFRNGEIAGLYLVMTSIVVVASLLLSVPLIDTILRLCFEKYIYTELTGYIPYIVSKMCFVKEVLLGIISYVVICLFMMLKIGKIEKSEALKNVE